MDTVFVSPREMEVVNLRIKGLTSRQIAAELGLKNHTVRTYDKIIHVKFKITNSVELANRVREVNAVVMESPATPQMKARAALNNAIRRKLITRKPCEKCGDQKTQGHHPDHSKPLSVVWLCKKHHDELHKKEGPHPRGIHSRHDS